MTITKQRHYVHMNDAYHKPNTNNQREKQRALALAALTQVAYLVERIGQEGKCESIHFNHCIDALLDDDYIRTRYFPLGSIKARHLLQGTQIDRAKHIFAHMHSLITLEKKLSKQPEALNRIAQDMMRIKKQIDYFNDPYHNNVISSIAHLYGETISNIKPTIIIRGKAKYLSQKQQTERLRCLLFSGIRAAWVWRTNGGNSLRLLFGRKKIIQQLEQNGHNS